MSRNLGALTPLDLSGPAWPIMGVLYLYLYLDYDFLVRNLQREIVKKQTFLIIKI
jgi:hypothetical protein